MSVLSLQDFRSRVARHAGSSGARIPLVLSYGLAVALSLVLWTLLVMAGGAVIDLLA